MSVGEAVSRFPRERTWLLPALQAAQRAEGWLSPETLATVAAHVRVPASEVWGVASHYPELRLAKPGRRVVRVCTGVACVARGGERLLERCERRLGIRAGEPTRDGAVTLEAMDCAFACAVAPVVEADHAYRGRVSEAALDALLDTPAAHVVPAPLTGRGGPPATPVTAGSPGARFTVLRREAERRRTGSRLAVGVGTCGLAVGAGETLEALRVEVQRRGLAWTVVAAGCNGMCWAAPVVEVLRDGKPPITAARVTADTVPRLLNALAANMAERDFAAAPDWMAAQRRLLTERCGLADPYDIADALRHGTYGTLARVLEEARPEAVIEEVRDAAHAAALSRGVRPLRQAHRHQQRRDALRRGADRRARGRRLRGAGRRPRHQALRPLRTPPAAGRGRDGGRVHAAHADRRDRRRRRDAGACGRDRRALGQRRAPAPVRRAADPARCGQSGDGRRGRTRRGGGRSRRRAHAARVQHAGVVRQVHAVPRGNGAHARDARRDEPRRRAGAHAGGNGPARVALWPRPGGAARRALPPRRGPAGARRMLRRTATSPSADVA